MADNELADRVVALGVVSLSEMSHTFYFNEGATITRSAHKLVRDWRVAGALMEKVADKPLFIEGGQCIIHTGYTPNGEGVSVVGTNESLPRAIIEACVEALGGDDE